MAAMIDTARLLLATAALLPGLIGSAAAQAPTLADALAAALARHPEAQAVAVREAEAQARVELAAGLTPAPAAVSLSSLNDRLGRNRGKDEWEAEIAVPLWLPGQQEARRAEAASGTAELVARRQALALRLAGELREVWWRLAAARQGQELASRRLETARALAADVERRFRAGDLARFDANLARSETLAAEAELLAARSTALAAEQAYRALTGNAPPDRLLAEVALSGADPGPDPGDDHPRLAAAAAAARLARARLQVADKSRRDAPSLALRLVRERADFADAYGNAVGVRLTIPFSSGPRFRQETAAARAEAAQAEAELMLARQQLALAAEAARLELATAAGRLATVRQRRLLAADNLALAEKSFALGESDLAGLLRVRAAALEAEALAAGGETALAAAESRYRQALGVLP